MFDALRRLFDRRTPPVTSQGPEPSIRAALKLESMWAGAPAPGLIPIDVNAAAEEPCQMTLRIFVGEAKVPALQTPMSLGPAGTYACVGLHSHLLPNGPCEVRADLVDEAGHALAGAAIALQIDNTGPLAEAVAASLRARGVPLAVDVCDSGTYDYADDSLAAWFDRDEAAVEAHLAELARSGAATPAEIEALRHFAAQGYMELPDVLGDAEVDRLNAALDDAVAKGVEGYRWGESQRLHNLHLTYPAIRELWLHPRILHMLELVFEAPPLACQSLTYVFGSEQDGHQDTVVLTPFPAGRMCGVWTALEDVQTDSGELMVFPRSQRLPRLYMRDIDCAKVSDDWSEFAEKAPRVWKRQLLGRFAATPYRPRKGTVLIWHENLMHGGRVRRDRSKSRRSIVGHYFADGAVAYHDASGLPGRLTRPAPRGG